MQWNKLQQQAIDRASTLNGDNRIFAVSGGPGTGKTTLMLAVVQRLQQEYSLVICAPTGKAAKRVTEATGVPAITMHRLLEYPWPGERDEKGKALNPGVPKRCKSKPIDQQIILIDEFPMVSHQLYRNLINATRRDGYLRMFGDINQLQPIEESFYKGKPSPYRMILDKGNGTELQEIMRTAADSTIPLNAAKILRGQYPSRTDDFMLTLTEKPQMCLEDFLYDDDYDNHTHQIIAPTVTKWCGAYEFNQRAQQMVGSPTKERIELDRHKWEEDKPVSIGIGDKIIWTENQYDLRQEYDRYNEMHNYIPASPEHQIMNGETGIVKSIDELGVLIDFGDREVNVPYEVAQYSPKHDNIITLKPLRSLQLGYVITTHKAQGSEWPHVMYILNQSSMWVQCRSNLYTAVTRASKCVTLVSDQKSLSHSLRSKISLAEAKDLASQRSKQS